MTCAEFQELAALAAMGSLGDTERHSLERHVANCADCRRAADEFAEASAMLGYVAPEASLPSDLKSRLMNRLERETLRERVVPAAPRRERRSRRASWRGVYVAASLVMLLGFGASVAGLGIVARDLSAERARNTRLEAQLKAQGDRLAMLDAMDLKVMPMAGQAAMPTAQGRVLWSPAHQAWVVSVAKLPPAAKGKTYQLWVVTPSAKISLGTFQTDPSGTAVVPASLPLTEGPIAAAAVSVEPAGGMPQPTGAIVLVGTI